MISQVHKVPPPLPVLHSPVIVSHSAPALKNVDIDAIAPVVTRAAERIHKDTNRERVAFLHGNANKVQFPSVFRSPSDPLLPPF